VALKSEFCVHIILGPTVVPLVVIALSSVGWQQHITVSHHPARAASTSRCDEYPAANGHPDSEPQSESVRNSECVAIAVTDVDGFADAESDGHSQLKSSGEPAQKSESDCINSAAIAVAESLDVDVADVVGDTDGNPSEHDHCEWDGS
jgi:hypothetical protein